MRTEAPLLRIQYLAVRGVYEWTCRRCNKTVYVEQLSKAEADGFAHVAQCRG